jgi:hypothetical protein
VTIRMVAKLMDDKTTLILHMVTASKDFSWNQMKMGVISKYQLFFIIMLSLLATIMSLTPYKPKLLH